MHEKTPHAVLRFVDDMGIVADVANTLFCEFSKFMSAQPGMSISKWKNSFNWLQLELGNKVGVNNKPRLVSHARRLEMVDNEARKIKNSTCELEKTNEDGGIAFFDTQSKLESDMSGNKKMVTVKAMLSNDRVLKAGPLNALNLLLDFLSTHALSRRPENKCIKMMSFNFLRPL